MLIAEFLDHSRCPVNISGAWECTSVVSHLLCVHRILGSFLSVCACAQVCVYTHEHVKKMQAQIQAAFSSKRSVTNPGPDPGPPTAPPPSTETRAHSPFRHLRRPEPRGLRESPSSKGCLTPASPCSLKKKRPPLPLLAYIVTA